MSDLNITDAIFVEAERRPHAVAIIDDETVISYRSLCQGVRLAALRFQRAGWRADDIVGISLAGGPSLHLLVSLALARSGITQVALPASDPPALIHSRLQRLGVTGLVSDHAMAAQSGVSTVVPEPGWLADTPNGPVADDVRAHGGDRIWLINETSGTTGTPKLIANSHADEDVYAKRQAPFFGHRPGERFLNLTGMRFSTGINRVLRCLNDGGTLTFPPAGINTEQLLRWIDLHHVAYIACVPLHLHQLLRGISSDSPRLPMLRILRCSSGALPVATLNDVRRRISPNLYVSYGASETGGISVATPDMLVESPDTAGRLFGGIELEIVDEQDCPVPAYATGHVRVRGSGVQLSYLNAGSMDQSRAFRNGWYYPGDIGVMDKNGLVFLKGRADEVMNFDGMLVGPAEIESVLRQHPAVLEVAAFPLPSNEHQDVPAAAIVSSQPLQIVELTRFCRERLGIRSPQIFFQVDEIPKNPMGKILRRELTRMALAGLQEKSRG